MKYLTHCLGGRPQPYLSGVYGPSRAQKEMKLRRPQSLGSEDLTIFFAISWLCDFGQFLNFSEPEFPH